MNCRCVVLNGKSPNPVCDSESSLPCPAVRTDVHASVIRLRLATDHASSVVIVRSSYPAPPSYWLLSLFWKYCTASSCPAAQGSTAFSPAFCAE